MSPYARRNHISSTVRDHTAILKFIERKWNLGALTLRDANSDDLSDCLNFHKPAFLNPPTLPPPALAASNPPACTPGDPGTIPPPEAVTPAAKSRADVRVSPGPAQAGPGVYEPLAEAWAKIQSGATR